jgi:hypothetical protein
MAPRHPWTCSRPMSGRGIAVGRVFGENRATETRLESL